MSSHCRSALICLTAALLPIAAHAIEPSQSIKITQLLKATQTWNGAPLKLIVFYAGAVDKQPLSVPRP